MRVRQKGLGEVNGEPWWDRTTDPLIKSRRGAHHGSSVISFVYT
jgi:hypothetical protein